MVGFSVGGSVLSATIGVVLQKLSSPAIMKVAAMLDFNENLNKMRVTLEKIKAYLADADRQVEIDDKNELLKLWIADLRSASYETDDLLEELHYIWLNQEIEGQSKVRILLSSTKTKLEMSSKILKAQRILEEILSSADQYQMQKLITLARENHKATDITQERVTTSLMGDETVVGRDDKKAKVIKQLMSKNEGVEVLTIYGIGGVGKTTLAQYVYNDKIVQEHFDIKIWVCVSDEFNVKRLTLEMLESALKQSEKLDNTHGCPDYRNPNECQLALSKELYGKKFLVVLDDVWNKNKKRWEEFKKPLVTTRGSESKILVTTRTIEVAKMMFSKPIKLEGLTDENFWTLFKRYAFGHSSLESNQKINLEQIGRKIAHKLKGSPLAAKTVGHVLSSNICLKHWDNILNTDLQKLPQEQHDIMPALRLSYQHLPEDLKPCFAFLSFFPKDCLIDEVVLKNFWIAHGFIHLEEMELPEDIATTYIDGLWSTGMIEIIAKGSNRSVSVHDLLHDLAQTISQDEYFHIRSDADLKKVPLKVRHLNIFGDRIMSLELNEFRRSFKNARTLVLYESISKKNSSFNDESLHAICVEAKHLRALVISGSRVAEPLSKCHFKYLCYLDLSDTDLKSLPESLCTSYNLQVLDVRGCISLNKLPTGITKLVNLRHLYTESTGVSTSSIRSVGKLRSLQELCFHVSKEVGHRMMELEEMNNIRELDVQHLDNVASKEEALAARLFNKKHLHSLILRWSDGAICDTRYDDILRALQPYNYLRVLELRCYGGEEFPPWEEKGSLPNIQKFILKDCENLRILKSLEHPELEHLAIEGCPNLKKIPSCRAPKLSKFWIAGCMEISLDSGFEGLVSLELLDIEVCPILVHDMVKQKWVLPSSLKCLSMGGGSDDPPMFTDDEFLAFMSNRSQNLSHLKILRIHGWAHITTLKEEVLQHMTSLEELEICSLVDLVSVDIRTLSSLRDFHIEKCDELRSLPDDGLPLSLRQLRIHECSNLESLPANLHKLLSLKTLHIYNCRKIKSFLANGFPPSLIHLVVK